MNPRQRRGVVLIAIAGVAAIAVFLAVAGYVSDVRAEVDPKSSVLRLARDVPARNPITAGDLEAVQMPDRWAPPTAIRDAPELAGRVAISGLSRGSLLQQDMVTDRPQLRAGERELAILVDAETGVAGKIGPGSVVDIQAAFEGDGDATSPASQVIVEGARVLEVGQVRPENGEQDVDPEEVVPVTFALTVRESLVLTYAESFADQVRLALVPTGEESRVPAGKRQFKRGGGGDAAGVGGGRDVAIAVGGEAAAGADPADEPEAPVRSRGRPRRR